MEYHGFSSINIFFTETCINILILLMYKYGNLRKSIVYATHYIVLWIGIFVNFFLVRIGPKDFTWGPDIHMLAGPNNFTGRPDIC